MALSSSHRAKMTGKKRKAKPSGDNATKKEGISNKYETVGRRKSKKSKLDRGTTTKKHSNNTSQRKHADVVAESKEIWNMLRQKNLSNTQRRELLDRLAPLIRGKCCDLCVKHDAARVVQAMIQFGTLKERRNVVQELTQDSGSVAQLAQNSYAHFCVLKAVQYCHTDDECLTRLLQNLKGHLAKLAVHAVGSRVVESLYTTIPPKHFQPLQVEFFGPHAQLFATKTIRKIKTTGDVIDGSSGHSNPPLLLESCLEQVPTEHKDSILNFVEQLISKGFEKNLYALRFFQDVLDQYCSVLSGKDVRALLQTHPTACDHAVHLINSKAGTRVICCWATYGTAKDRKRMLQSFKGYARSGLLHTHAYLGLLRLTQLTDDTVALHKYLFHECLTTNNDKEGKNSNHNEKDGEEDHPLLELALSNSAHKLLLLILLLPDVELLQKKLDPYEASILEPGKVPTLESSADNDGGNGTHHVPTSKKETPQRHKELLSYFRQPLLGMCARHAEQLLVSRSGSAVLQSVYQALGRPKEVTQAVLRVCQMSKHDASNENPKGSAENILNHCIGHLAVKNFVLADASAEEKSGEETSASLSFSRAFLAEYDKAALTKLALAGNRGAFVVSALYKVPSLRPNIQIDSKALERQIKKAKEEKQSEMTHKRDGSEHNKKKKRTNNERGASGSTAGLQALLKAIESP